MVHSSSPSLDVVPAWSCSPCSQPGDRERLRPSCRRSNRPTGWALSTSCSMGAPAETRRGSCPGGCASEIGRRETQAVPLPAHLPPLRRGWNVQGDAARLQRGRHHGRDERDDRGPRPRSRRLPAGHLAIHRGGPRERTSRQTPPRIGERRRLVYTAGSLTARAWTSPPLCPRMGVATGRRRGGHDAEHAPEPQETRRALPRLLPSAPLDRRNAGWRWP